MANKIMTNKEFVEKALWVAKDLKTLYVMGCFGAPMNDTNKNRYKNNNDYNRQPERQQMINNASADTFGFDCVCLIKGILWGFSGDANQVYGGAQYGSNGLGDMSIPTMVDKNSYDDTKDFSNIALGELVYMEDGGHIGIYVGNGLAVECTPAWENKVQITAVKNIGEVAGYNSRKWDWHCKFNYIDYVANELPKEEPVEDQKEANTDTFKVGDKVIPIKLQNYVGVPLMQYDEVYEIMQIDDRGAVLGAERSDGLEAWAVLSLDNIKKAE